jgi:Histidine kinase
LRMFIVSALGSAIITYFTCPSCSHNPSKFALITFFSFLMWVLMWIGSESISHFVARKISWVNHPVKALLTTVIATAIFTLTAGFGFAKSLEYARDMEFANYYSFLIVPLIISFLISSFMHGREFLLGWREAAVKAERYEKENMVAQYENLKTQVDPHFLFNSLNVLTSLVYEDTEKSVKFIKQLSEVYRYVLDTRSKEVVTLAEELKFVDAYLYLQQIRFGDKLIIENNLRNKEGMVAPLVLQMLVENAIKHNTISIDDPLTIKMYETGGAICVENNLQQKNETYINSMGIGLENIRKRYAFLSDKPVEVEKQRDRFKVAIPILSYDK